MYSSAIISSILLDVSPEVRSTEKCILGYYIAIVEASYDGYGHTKHANNESYILVRCRASGERSTRC